MTPAELVERYLLARETLGISKLTIRNQKSHLRRFVSFLESASVEDIADVTREIIESYMEHLTQTRTSRGRQMKARTRNQRIISIKGFCRWLVTSDIVTFDPAEKVDYCREPRTLPRDILTVEEMRVLLSTPSMQTPLGVRDRVVLELLYSTAVRVAELCGLDVADVDLDAGLAHVREGKGGKDRVVPVGRLACELVEGYLVAVRPMLLERRTFNTHEPALILSQYGQRLGRAGVAKLIARHADRAGLAVHVTPHTFRHACATHMLRGGANLRHLQQMLGHEKITSTEIYTRVTITELKEVHGRFHPRAQLEEADVRGNSDRES